MYTKSYYNRPTNLADIKDIKNRLNTSINTITASNMDVVGEPNISKLLSRANSELNGNKSIAKNIEDLFSDSSTMDALLQSYMQNKYLVDLDQEIDIICKYMPKLVEALDTKKDNVLSADHFSMDYIYLKNATTIPDSTFSERIKTIKEKYDLLAEVDSWYSTASKYGEQFLYIIPFNRAISKLMNQRKEDNKFFNNDNTVVSVSESGFVTLMENSVVSKEAKNMRFSEFNIEVEYDGSGFLRETVEAKYNAVRESIMLNEQSLCEQQMAIIEQAIQEKGVIGGKPKEAEPEVQTSISKKINSKFVNTIDVEKVDTKDFFNYDDLSRDGLINTKAKGIDNDVKSRDLNIPGCIIKKLKREMVNPIYIEDICLGYIYIEVKDQSKFKFNNSLYEPTPSNMFERENSKNLGKDDLVDKKLKNLASQISKFIDTKFVNANVDLAKEIYIMLKHNDLYSNPSKSVKITFLPAEDVEHIKFAEDQDTHRGISDLSKALFPAKIYCAMYLVYAIANMTRGYDRRVYYVKQTVDTNVAKSLLTTINQLKKSNFNIRQVENINNIIGISGSLHDYLIPTMGGDPPIQFEVMQGQNIEAPTEALQILEEMAINSTDVPLELIQARQSMDYAVHYTMTNSKFLRKVYNRQTIYAKILSRIFTKIYNYEFSSNDKLTVTLPPPMFLNITNTNQIMQNSMDFANNISNIWMADEQDESKKAKFLTKVQKYYIGSYLDIDMLERLYIETEQELSTQPKEQ